MSLDCLSLASLLFLLLGMMKQEHKTSEFVANTAFIATTMMFVYSSTVP